MIVNAYAKINWALNILGQRPDGYHEMDMLMQRVSLCDALQLEPAAPGELNLDCSDPSLAGPDNLILRAARALNRRAGGQKGARIRLTKRIPSRAGLGGGSADCAAALIALNQLWHLNLPGEELRDIARALGAAVPYRLGGSGARVRGLGEVIEPCPLPRGIPLVILHPGGGLSTPRMFRAWDAERTHAKPADIDECRRLLQAGDLAGLSAASQNALLPAAIRSLPEIKGAIEALRRVGAPFAQMSGSGSAVFGAFPSRAAAERARSQLGGDALLCETR